MPIMHKDRLKKTAAANRIPCFQTAFKLHTSAFLHLRTPYFKPAVFHRVD